MKRYHQWRNAGNHRGLHPVCDQQLCGSDHRGRLDGCAAGPLDLGRLSLDLAGYPAQAVGAEADLSRQPTDLNPASDWRSCYPRRCFKSSMLARHAAASVSLAISAHSRATSEESTIMTQSLAARACAASPGVATP